MEISNLVGAATALQSLVSSVDMWFTRLRSVVSFFSSYEFLKASLVKKKKNKRIVRGIDQLRRLLIG